MTVDRTLQSIADVLADHEAAYHPGQLCPEDQHGHCAARPRPVPSPEDRMADARTDTPHTFRTYLDATERAQLDARAATAEAERDEAIAALRDTLAELKDRTAGLRAERVKTGRLEGDLRSQTRALREALAERDKARAENAKVRKAAQTYREVMVEQHGWAGHLIEGECAPCIAAAAEWDGDLACDEYKRWQQRYEAAMGVYLPAASPSSVPSRRAQEPRPVTEPTCDGLCLYAADIGIPGYGVAYAHPGCPAHDPGAVCGCGQPDRCLSPTHGQVSMGEALAVRHAQKEARP